MSEAEDVLAFHAEHARLRAKRDAALAKRLPPGKEDPDWEAAKAEYAEFRTAIRALAEAAGTRKPGATASPSKEG